MRKDQPCEETALIETSQGKPLGKSALMSGESCVGTSPKPRCPHCQSDASVIKSGTNRSGTQRFFCRVCARSFTPYGRQHGADPSLKEQAVVLNAQGRSTRAIARTLGVDHQTVRRWLQAAQARPVEGDSEKHGEE